MLGRVWDRWSAGNAKNSEVSETSFAQSDRGTRLTFWFKEDHLFFKEEDGAGMSSRKVPYEQIDFDSSWELLVKNHYLKRPDLFVLFAGIAILQFAANPSRTIGLAFGTLYVGLGIRLYYDRRRGMPYTFFRTTESRIRIMRNSKYEVILETLKKYRTWIMHTAGLAKRGRAGLMSSRIE
jgi:hypothetical protein